MDIGAIIGIIVAVVVVLAIVIFWISTHNGLVALKNTVEEGWSTIDVQCKKRYDLIPNLVETVKGYAKHEGETLEKVIAARNVAATATSTEEKIAAEKQFSGSIRNIFALAENYPDLKANTNFIDLQGQLKSIETEIAAARRYYNGTVKEYNTKIQSFPANIVANSMKLTKQPYFELDSAEERKAVSVKF